jgi:hypothetical protein
MILMKLLATNRNLGSARVLCKLQQQLDLIITIGQPSKLSMQLRVDLTSRLVD